MIGLTIVIVLWCGSLIGLLELFLERTEQQIVVHYAPHLRHHWCFLAAKQIFRNVRWVQQGFLTLPIVSVTIYSSPLLVVDVAFRNYDVERDDLVETAVRSLFRVVPEAIVFGSTALYLTFGHAHLRGNDLDVGMPHYRLPAFLNALEGQGLSLADVTSKHPRPYNFPSKYKIKKYTVTTRSFMYHLHLTIDIITLNEPCFRLPTGYNISLPNSLVLTSKGMFFHGAEGAFFMDQMQTLREQVRDMETVLESTVLVSLTYQEVQRSEVKQVDPSRYIKLLNKTFSVALKLRYVEHHKQADQGCSDCSDCSDCCVICLRTSRELREHRETSKLCQVVSRFRYRSWARQTAQDDFEVYGIQDKLLKLRCACKVFFCPGHLLQYARMQHETDCLRCTMCRRSFSTTGVVSDTLLTLLQMTVQQFSGIPPPEFVSATPWN